MASISTDRPDAPVVALLAGLGIGFVLATTAGQPLAWHHTWPGWAVLCWTVAVVWPRWARLAFVGGLACYLTWHIGAMAVARPPYPHLGWPAVWY